MSKAEECLLAALEADPIPGWDLTREFRFHPTRRWRWDFCFPSQKLAIEVDGEMHRRKFSMARADYEKLNEAVRLGWRVLRFQASQRSKAKRWAELVRECLIFPPSSASESEEWQPPME